MHVERKHDYLSGALRALAQSELSLATTLTGSDVRVLVYDATPNQPSKQAENAKKMFGDDTLFDFSRGQGSQKHAISNAAKQSRDVASAAEAALSNYDFHYALLLEDDWIPCKGLFSSLMLALEAARRTFGSDVMAVRVSYGLNGVLIPRDPLSSFADFVRQRAGRIPPDHALTRWAQQRGKLVTFRHNQFVHVGAQSSIGNSGQRWNTACYELLFDWLEIESEAFQIDACGHDVISPCSPKAEDAKKNPTPQRRHKKFTCDVALKEFPAYLASARLGACVVDAIPSSKLTTSKLFHSQPSRSLM